jgi:preprotein translocase subunit SecY
MTLRSRYGLVLFAIVGYYAHFFVPLLSLTRSDSSRDAGVVPGMDFLQGLVVYDYHYLSVGIIPFIMSSLILQLFRWQIPEKIIVFSGADGNYENFQRITTYIIAAVMSAVIVMGIPENRFEYHPLVSFTELMLSVCSIDYIIRFIKPLKVISSPVMLFLGANVMGVMVNDYVSLEYDKFNHIDVSYFLLSTLLVVVTIVLAIWCYRMKRPIHIGRATRINGEYVAQRVDVPVFQSGLMPVIYASVITLPLVAYLHSGIEMPAELMFKAPYWYVFFGLLVYWFNCQFTLFQVSPDKIQRYCERNGIAVLVGSGVDASLSDTLISTIKKNSILVAFIFSCLFLMQGAWQASSPESLSHISVVGGVSFILLVSVVADAMAHYRNHLRWRGI